MGVMVGGFGSAISEFKLHNISGAITWRIIGVLSLVIALAESTCRVIDCSVFHGMTVYYCAMFTYTRFMTAVDFKHGSDIYDWGIYTACDATDIVPHRHNLLILAICVCTHAVHIQHWCSCSVTSPTSSKHSVWPSWGWHGWLRCNSWT